MKHRRLYDTIIPLCIFCAIIFWYCYNNMPDPEASANPPNPSEEHGPWNVEYIQRKGVGNPHEPVPTLFLKGQSLSGVDVLLVIERLPNGEIITVTCPIPEKASPYGITIIASKDHCILKRGEVPKTCCLTRIPWLADMHVQNIKDKGYIFTVAPKDVGMLLSHLTDAQTLWIVTKNGELFTFRVAGFSKFYDDTLHNNYGLEQDPARAFRQAVRRVLTPSEMNKDLLSALDYYPDLHIRIINYLTAEEGSKAWTLALGKLNIGLQKADLDPKIFDSINALRHALRADSTFIKQVRLVILNEMKRK